MDSMKIGEVIVDSKIGRISQAFRSLKTQWVSSFLSRGWLFYLIGFLLGRAIVLSSVSPFAIAFLGATIVAKKSLAFRVYLFLALGAWTVNLEQTFYVLGTGLLLFLCYKHWLSKMTKMIYPMIFTIFLSSVIARTSVVALVDSLTLYNGAIIFIEALLASFLVMIFLQSYPFLTIQVSTKKLKVEELVCLVIFVTAILTGLAGIQFYDLQLEVIGASYFILMGAYISGATVGAAVGVIVGLMLSFVNMMDLYHVSLLALAGLMVGLLKDMHRLISAFGLFLAVLLIGFYNIEVIQFEQLVIEASIATGLFLLTPQGLLKKIAGFVPGTNEEKESQDQYAEKIRHVTAERVERFSEMFQALSHSFASIEQEGKQLENQAEVDEYLSRVTENTCQSCLKKHSCWVQHFDRTYPVLRDMIQSIEEKDTSRTNFNVGKLRKFCVKPEQMTDQMRYELSYYHANKRLKQQVKESRKFVSEQLNGVSEVMNNFAKEMMKEREEYSWHEEEIRRVLGQMNILLERLELYSIHQGNIDIELTAYFHDYHGEAEKLIAPYLSDLLGETVVVEKEEAFGGRNGYRTFHLSSIRKFQLTTGISHAAKNGNFLSGDSYMIKELGKSRYALAISDGMGNGERAYQESSETLRLLQQILNSGISEEVAIQSINSILSLRTSDEIYATLDLAIVDLQQPYVNFLKIGATVSYILRGSSIYPVESGNLPIGILEEFDVEPVREDLKDGDILVMASDGILESTDRAENREAWLKRKLRHMETKDPQEIADLLLEEVVRSNYGQIVDDMTVLVAKVDKSKPKWASFTAFVGL
ncbi:stage II sporulation protein E [Allobacillus halotolerans]|uniref:Stage II sporulation protein E n=1 Tax=Allobacillus halotolerans TaxID=570278 RepID=A0ABS6GMF0_9BACI|nr:stage II sporulation protein E [Allobacillus halotolerans]MBU6080140.1 stage II sporulation protein E [Allobacillus halotolerans]